jgi:hypothetical protein
MPLHKVKKVVADVLPAAELRPSHEQLVHAFFASCDKTRLTILEHTYPVLDKEDWIAIEENERDSISFDNLTEIKRPAAVPVRATSNHGRRRIPVQITSLDQCQSCGSWDAACACCFE